MFTRLQRKCSSREVDETCVGVALWMDEVTEAFGVVKVPVNGVEQTANHDPSVPPPPPPPPGGLKHRFWVAVRACLASVSSGSMSTRVIVGVQKGVL